jgi:hypothetical protein
LQGDAAEIVDFVVECHRSILSFKNR